MPRFSANLTTLFCERPFPERFEAASRAGFKAVEYMFPYPYPKERLAELLAVNGLSQVLINLPAGDWEAGERGIALLPDRVDEFEKGVGEAVAYAKALDCDRVNCLVGLTPPGVPPEKARQTLVANLRFAAGALAGEGMALLVEAVNVRDVPGFHLTHTKDVLSLIDEVGEPNVLCQYDVYHMQVMEGDLTETLRRNLSRIGHIQVADNPGRHEPGTGEINFTNLFRFIDEAGYKGFIGCEYRPAAGTEEGLGWLKAYIQEV